MYVNIVLKGLSLCASEAKPPPPPPLQVSTFSWVYLGACVEPCVKNIPTVNNECVRARNCVHVRWAIVNYECNAAAGAMGPKWAWNTWPTQRTHKWWGGQGEKLQHLKMSSFNLNNNEDKNMSPS